MMSPNSQREANLTLTYRLWEYRLTHLDEPVSVAVSKPLLTELAFIIDWRVVTRLNEGKNKEVLDFELILHSIKIH